MLDGQMHGQGKLVYENGECYNGEWVKGVCELNIPPSDYLNQLLNHY